MGFEKFKEVNLFGDSTFADRIRAAMEAIYTKFDADDVATRPGAKGKVLYYIEGYKLIDFMNHNFGLQWSAYCDDVRIDTVRSRERGPYEKGKPVTYVFEDRSVVTVICNVSLTLKDSDGKDIITTSRPGIGADVVEAAGDIDKTVKTALINAMKKGFFNFGVTNYLWVEEERQEVNLQKQAMVAMMPHNEKKIQEFSVAHQLNTESRRGLLSDIFAKGVTLGDGTYVIGTDGNVFLHSKQDLIVDYFIAEAARLINGGN